jgi:hypothetical protein
MRVKPISPLSLAAAFSLSAVLFAGGCKSSTPTTPANETAASQPAPAATPATQPAPAPATTPEGVAPAPAPGVAPAPATTAAAPPAPMPAAAAPAPPPEPVKLTVPAGSKVTVVVTQQLSAKNNNVGDPFTGELASAMTTSGGSVVFGKGTPVQGTVVAAKGRGKFKGEGNLAIQVSSIGGHAATTSSYLKQEKGKGKRSAGLIGGGAGGGALIGGLAGGGKGALIGGLVGAGAGTAGAALTGNKDIVIPAESVVTFTLQSPITVTRQPKQKANP